MKKRSLKISLTNQIMIATVLGIFWGVSFPGLGDQMQLVGDFFLRLIQMSVVVLVMGSVIEAVGGTGSKRIRWDRRESLPLVYWIDPRRRYFRSLVRLDLQAWRRP